MIDLCFKNLQQYFSIMALQKSELFWYALQNDIEMLNEDETWHLRRIPSMYEIIKYSFTPFYGNTRKDYTTSCVLTAAGEYYTWWNPSIFVENGHPIGQISRGIFAFFINIKIEHPKSQMHVATGYVSNEDKMQQYLQWQFMDNGYPLDPIKRKAFLKEKDALKLKKANRYRCNWCGRAHLNDGWVCY